MQLHGIVVDRCLIFSFMQSLQRKYSHRAYLRFVARLLLWVYLVHYSDWDIEKILEQKSSKFYKGRIKMYGNRLLNLKFTFKYRLIYS